jgi:hypothetical protein
VTGEPLSDDARIGRLPVHVARSVLRLRGAVEARGEHDCAPEVVALIEAVISFLGRLWVAEYLAAGAPDARLNRDLFDLLGRRPLLGHWVSLARRIREIFVAHALRTVVAGLDAVDYGSPDNPDHPVSRLIRYRNSFSHGSMAAVVEDIRLHRRLIAELMSLVPALIEQPIRWVGSDGGPPRLATLEWPLAPDRVGAGEPPLQPFVVGAEGAILRLYPLLYVVETEEGPDLRTPDGRDRTHPLTSLFEREALRIWYERYRHERRGHVKFDDVAVREVTPVPRAVFPELSEALADDAVSLILVEAHPGCGKTVVLTRLRELAPRGRFADVSIFVVSPGDLGQSGITFACFLLRRAEAALGLPDGTYADDPAQLLGALRDAKERLRHAGRRVLVGLEDLHFGYAPYRGEPLTVADVYRSLAGGAITVVATSHVGRIPRRVVFDHRILVPVPEASEVDRVSLARAVAELCPQGAPLRRRVLEQLVMHEQPLSLFAICDRLEEDGSPVFEPAVERALWDLRPLLRTQRDGSETSWAPFSAAVAETARDEE